MEYFTKLACIALSFVALNCQTLSAENAGPVLTNPSACGLALPINDNNCDATHLFEIVVTNAPGNALGTNVFLKEVHLTIAHQWDADLDMRLISPNGVAVELSTDNGSGNDNYGDPADLFCNTFTTFVSHASVDVCDNVPSITEGHSPFIGAFFPEGNFTDFNDGTNPNQSWILQICDDAEVHYGTLEFVELVFAEINCLTPSQLSVLQFDSTTLTLDWDIGSNCANTVVDFGAVGFAPGTDFSSIGGTVVSVACPPVTITGLSPSASYEFYVREFCGGADFSGNSCPVAATTLCSPPPATLTEDFDSQNLCPTTCPNPCPISGLWTNALDDDFDWTVDHFGTNSSQTGPSDDVSGGGNYIYIEASGSLCQNTNEAVLISNCIEVQTSSDTCDLSFYYHMFGFHINKISLEVTRDGGMSWEKLWEKQGNQGDRWFLKFIDLSAYDAETVQFRFVRKGGTGFRGDIALDQIVFYGSKDLGPPPFVFYQDKDADGFGNSSVSVANCNGIAPPGFVEFSGDCDDNDPIRNPAAVESPCDGVDLNCNGFVDEFALFPPPTFGDSICSGTLGTVTATPQAGGTINWYDSETGGNLLHQGNSFSPVSLLENNGTAPVSFTFYAAETNQFGCFSAQRSPASILVYPQPDILNESGDMETCAGVPVNLTALNISDANGAGIALSYFNNSDCLPANELASPVVQPETTTTYFIKATAAGGCFDVASATIFIKPSPQATIQADTSFCLGTTQVLTALASGNGIPPLTFSWNTAATSPAIQVFSNPLVGAQDSYFVTIAGNNGCTGSDTISLTTVQSITSVNIVTDPVTICNGTDGAVSVIPQGGLPPYDYIWGGTASGIQTGVAGSLLIENLLQGSYSITVTDNSPQGCAFRIPLVAVNGPAAVVTLAGLTAATCKGASDGCISINVSGNNPTIQWNTGATSPDICGLAAGNYFVTVTEDTCSNVLGPIVLTEPNALQAIPTSGNVQCIGQSDGFIDLRIFGGTPPYSFNWSNATQSEDQFDLPGGNYFATITDSHNCSLEIGPIIIKEPSALQIDLLNLKPVSCHGQSDGQIVVDVSGGVPPYSLAWSNNQFSFENKNLPKASYELRVTDANGCEKSKVFQITEPDTLSLTFTPTNASCNGIADGQIFVSASGGTAPFEFNWNNGVSGSLNNGLSPGSYWVTITDLNGCQKVSDRLFLSAPQMLDLEIAKTDPFCNGINDGSIELVIQNGNEPFQFSWNNGATSQNLNTLPAGHYEVVITDASGCQFDTSATLVAGEPLAVNATILHPSCFGDASGEINLNIAGGSPPYFINWNTGAQDNEIKDLVAGAYFATINDFQACQFILDTITLTDPPPVEIMGRVERISCNGSTEGSIDIAVEGGVGNYSFNWSNGANSEDISGLGSGNYFLTLTDANGCSLVSDAFPIEEPPPLQAFCDLINVPECGSDPIDSLCVIVSGGSPPYEFLWSNGSVEPCLVHAPTGDYALTITDAAGCEKVMFDVKVPDPIAPISIHSTLGDSVTTVCAGASMGELEVVVQGGEGPYQFLWSHGGDPGLLVGDTLSISGLEDGFCNVTLTDQNGCVAVSDSFTILRIDPILLNAPSESILDVNCKGMQSGSIDLNVSGGTTPYRYLWENQDGQPLPDTMAATQDPSLLGVGFYSVVVLDSNQCQAMLQNIPIAEPAEGLTIFETPPLITEVSCFGDSDGLIDITVTGGVAPYSYEWSNGSNGEDLLNVEAGYFGVTITDSEMCSQVFDSILVSQSDGPLSIENAEITDNQCFGDAEGSIAITVSGGRPAYTFDWSTNVNNTAAEDVDSLLSGNYFLTVFDSKGCTIETFFVVADPGELLFDFQKTPVNPGFQDGAISVAVTGGTPPYELDWSTGESTATISNLAVGTYALTVTDANACVKTEETELDFVTGIIDHQLLQTISLFPNPTSGLLHLQLILTKPQNLTFDIFNLIGKRVESISHQNFESGNVGFNLKDHPAGTYFLRIKAGRQPIFAGRLILIN